MGFTFIRSRLPLLCAGLFGILMVALAVVGAMRNYSPVPFSDMWDGYLHFFLAVRAGDHSAWWVQHNEHRILLSHLLFWADLRWFGGSGRFLLLMNYVLAGAGAGLFWRLLRDRLAPQPRDAAEMSLALFSLGCLFSWMQQENLEWAFQSQFFLVQLLPLSAFYLLQQSGCVERRPVLFALACLSGLAAIGSMANGILALPMMVAYALLMRQGWRSISMLAVLSCLSLGLFFRGYVIARHQSPLSQLLMHQPLSMVAYVLSYLGNPWHFLAAATGYSRQLALLGGLLLVGGAGYHAMQWSRRRDDGLGLVLLFFIAYVMGTALITAAGRVQLGVDQAFASRYTTPVLMAWIALLVLSAPALVAAMRAGQPRCLLAFAALACALLYLQIDAVRPQNQLIFEKSIAGLALELGIADQQRVARVHPFAELILPTAQRARGQELSIFGLAPWRGVHRALSGAVPPAATARCQGGLDSLAAVDGNLQFLRLSGWMLGASGQDASGTVRFVDMQGKLAGYALAGKPRYDLAPQLGKARRRAGFEGYLLADRAGGALIMQAGDGSCAILVRLPGPVSWLATQRARG